MSGTGVSGLAHALSRRHWLIWMTALLAAALALAATLVRPPTYEATTLLSIDETQTVSQGFDVAIQADQFLTGRYISMATSRPVLQQVCAREGGGCDPDALAGQVRATTTKATGQLAIVADARSPAAATQLADDVADQLIARNRKLLADEYDPQRAVLQRQVQQLNASVSQTLAQTQAAEAGGRSDAALLSQLSLLQGQYSSTYQQMQSLDVQESQLANSITVEQRATPPQAPADPDPVRYAVVGGAGGLAAGFLLALLAERLRTRILQASELGEAARCRLVLDLSRQRSLAGAPFGLVAQAGLAGAPGERPALLLVASSAGDRVNDAAVELASSLVPDHRRVLVVLAVPPGGSPPDRREVTADGARVVLVPAEADGRRAHELRAQADFDLVVASSLAPLQDQGWTWLRPAPRRAILVATRARTRFTEARRAADVLRELGVEVVAAILLPASMPPSTEAVRLPAAAPATAPALER